MALWIAGFVFLTIVCYAVYLVVVAVKDRFKRKPVYKIYDKNSRLMLMTDTLKGIEFRDGDKVDKVKVRWRPHVNIKPIDGMRRSKG